MSRHRTTAAALLILLATGVFAGTASAAVPRLIFPVVGKVSYTDDFGAPRWQGRHEGNDLMAAKRSPVVAVERGRVVKYTSSRAAGCMLYLYGRSGTKYMYIHLNNDVTLRNDNRGGCKNGIAYAPGLQSSQQVQAGQLIAYVGDSGDANGIASHLHFELHPNGGRAVSPYRHLRAAFKHLYARPPAAVTTLNMRVEGTVVYTVTDIDPQRIRIRVTRVAPLERLGLLPEPGHRPLGRTGHDLPPVDGARGLLDGEPEPVQARPSRSSPGPATSPRTSTPRAPSPGCTSRPTC